MARGSAALLILCLLGINGSIGHGSDDPPALDPPGDLPAVVGAPPASPARPRPPAPRPAITRPAIPRLEPIESDDSSPALIGPAEMSTAPAPTPRGPGAGLAESGSLISEPGEIPGDEPGPARTPPGGDRPGRRRPVPSARRPRLFGLFSSPAGRDRRAGRDDAVQVEPRSDPASDAALKRRIERQVRDAVGDRVRSVEVMVVDRNITVRTRVSRFWYRRSVRRTLETLPGLAGTRAKIEVLD